MESINALKGYGKVNSTPESQPPSPSRRKPLLIAAALLFLTLTISLILAAAIFDFDSGPAAESRDLDSLSSSDSAQSIRTVCNVTRYPDSCFSSISSLNPSVKPDPKSIFGVSIQASINELKNVSAEFRALNQQAAVEDCVSQLDDALSKLGDSLAVVVAVGSGDRALNSTEISDVQTWISAAMTYDQTCEDGLEEMGSTVPDAIKGQLGKLNELLSNSLAIVANMQPLAKKFGSKLH